MLCMLSTKRGGSRWLGGPKHPPPALPNPIPVVRLRKFPLSSHDPPPPSGRPPLPKINVCSRYRAGLGTMHSENVLKYVDASLCRDDIPVSRLKVRMYVRSKHLRASSGVLMS